MTNGAKKLKDRSHGLTLIWLAFFLIGAVALVRGIYHLGDITKNRIRNDLEIEFIGLERTLTDKIDYTFSIIKSINLQIETDPTNKKHIYEILKRYQASAYLSDSFSWTVFSWTNPNYQIIVDAKYGILKEPVDLSIRDYVPQTEKQPEVFHLGTPVLGLITKKWLIPGGVGVVDEKGKYIGATIIGFEVETLAKWMHKVAQNPVIDFKLFGKNEVEILHGNPRIYSIHRSSDDETYNSEIGKILNQLNLMESDNIYSVSLFYNRHAFLAKKVTQYPYVLFLKYDNKAILSKFWSVLLSHSIEVFLTIFGLIFLLILILRETNQDRKIIIAQRVAERAGAVKTRFLTQTVNEFKNFIFGIHGCSEIVKNDLQEILKRLKKEKNSDKNEVSEFEHNLDLISQVIDSSRKLNDFVDHLIVSNKLENNSLQIHRSRNSLNLGKLIKQAQKIAQKKVKIFGARLKLHIEKGLYKVADIDKERFKQIIVNLIINAVTNSEKNCTVNISAKNVAQKELREINAKTAVTRTKRVAIIVEDEGCGMDEHEVKSIVEKFQVIQNSEDDDSEFGLPVIKFLVEQQGGVFEITSEKNKGTKIKIIF